MELKNKLIKIINDKKTLLGVGPMSLNVVDSSIELSNFYNIPIMLIASRRQIDIKELGSGYVEGWSTKQFADYVKKKDRKKNIILCRDHGGPWQNQNEIKLKLSTRKAMESAKKSYHQDIYNDFQIIHIDPSISSVKKNSTNDILNLIYELYEFCHQTSKKYKKEILFELGTEEQNKGFNTIDELSYWIDKIKSFCKKNKIPDPFFIVSQTGTKVMELKNIGSFDDDIRQKNQLPAEIQIPKIIKWASENNVYLKEHNADYLSNDALKWHPRLGIHASNVAPEFATAETNHLLYLLKYYNLKKERDLFIEISVKSQKWKKWMMSDNKNKSDEYKARISGHYVFNNNEIKEIKNKLNYLMNKNNYNLNKELKKKIKDSILRYIYNFRLIENI